MTMNPEVNFPTTPGSTVFGYGEMVTLMRSYDWANSPLGSVETWPESLKTAIRIILGSRYPMFIWWGPDLINFYNDAYIPMLGKRHPTALGQSARKIWAELWPSVGPLADEVMNHGNPSWNEEFLEVLERNGYPEETYFTFSYSPIGLDSGGVGGIFCACTEDTRRVIDDRRLKTLRELKAEAPQAKTVNESCQFSTRVLGNNPRDIPFALIYLLDETQHQAQLVATTNLEMGTIASPPVIELYGAGNSADGWSLNTVLTSGQSQVINQLVDRFGTLPGGAWDQSPNSAIVLPLTRPGQKILGFLVAGLSPVRPLDDDYRGFFDLVAGQINTAIINTLALEEERQQAEVLTELDRTKINFFNNISHEFRTPLTLMLSPAEDALMDQADPLSPPQQERIKVIQRNGLRLLKLVNSLLDFSRIESNLMQAVYEPTDLASYTTDLASVFRSAIEQAGLRLNVDCSPLSEPVYVDREMWEKIVLNLLSNAFKFTFEGEISVRLRGSVDGDGGVWEDGGDQEATSRPSPSSLPSPSSFVVLEVRDTGIGIPAAEIPNLFQRFHQVKGAQGRTSEGSGIGLSLVQELVKLHGGTVQVTSVEGEGSCFTVTIPLGTAHLPQDQIGSPKDGSTGDVSTQLADSQNLLLPATGAASYLEEALCWSLDGGGRVDESIELSTNPSAHSQRILLVDDNIDLRNYLARLLSQRWQVDTAANGAIALQLIQQEPPDLVLTDVMMPEMDGFQLLRALRTNPETEGIPIIMLSARAGEESMIEGLEAGADDYLIKPFSARELIARVQTQLQMSRLRQEQAASRFKEEFLKTITHELQAPLVSILGWARLLRSKNFDPRRTEQALSTIERNATVEAKLVKDLLDVSSLLSGNLRLKAQLVEIVALVHDAVAKQREIALAKNIQLTETIENIPDITILADGDRLRQIIIILLENALKFTDVDGRVEVKVSMVNGHGSLVGGRVVRDLSFVTGPGSLVGRQETEVRSDQIPDFSDSQQTLSQPQQKSEISEAEMTNFIQIAVTDTGIGISPEFLPHVFERFSQAQVPSLYSPGGVGIGLAIARYLVELHQGTIEASSEGEGRGATFTVRLPMRMR